VKKKIKNTQNNTIESYILKDYKPKKGHSVGESLMLSCCGCCFVAVLGWSVFHVIAIFGNEPMRILPLNIALIILLPTFVFLTLKLLKKSLCNHINGTDKTTNNTSNIAAWSSIGAVGGTTLARIFMPTMSAKATAIFLNVIALFFILVFVFGACVQYYRIYLIRKHCPHLR